MGQPVLPVAFHVKCVLETPSQTCEVWPRDCSAAVCMLFEGNHLASKHAKVGTISIMCARSNDAEGHARHPSRLFCRMSCVRARKLGLAIVVPPCKALELRICKRERFRGMQDDYDVWEDLVCPVECVIEIFTGNAPLLG